MYKLTRRRFLQGIAALASLPILGLLPVSKFFTQDKISLAPGVITTVNRLTAYRSGIYLVSGQVGFDRPIEATALIFSGDKVVASYQDAQMINGTVTAIVFKQDADPVELRVYHNSGGIVEVSPKMTMVHLG